MGEVYYIVHTPIQLLIYSMPVTEAFFKLCVCKNHICCVRNPCCRKRIYCRGRDWLNCIEGLHSMLHRPFGYTVYMQDNKHAYALNHRVRTEWQLPIYGVHSIMMEKSALAGEGGGCTPTPFHSVTITYKVAVYAPAERADKPPLFHLYPML